MSKNNLTSKILGSSARGAGDQTFTLLKRGGQLGKSNPITRAEALGFVRTDKGRYEHPEGHVLLASCHYGATSWDNRFHFTLTLARTAA